MALALWTETVYDNKIVAHLSPFCTTKMDMIFFQAENDRRKWRRLFVRIFVQVLNSLFPDNIYECFRVARSFQTVTPVCKYQQILKLAKRFNVKLSIFH